jgi:hypothetical protein
MDIREEGCEPCPYHLQSVLRRVPIIEETPGWNCVAWVEEALQQLERDGKALGTSVLKVTTPEVSNIRHY